MLKWDSSYDLGHKRIDAEHRIFLELIGDFQLAASGGAPLEKLTRIFREIWKYADFHFVSEENVMAEFGYPDRHHHASLHQMLLAQVGDKYLQFQDGSLAPDHVFDFLFNWFALHTTREDKKLVGYLHEIRQSTHGELVSKG